MAKSNLEILNKTKGKLPSLPFALIKENILTAKYELSLVFISNREIQKLNKIYRNINRPTDILSFPLSKNTGEIFICPTEAKKEMTKFGQNYTNFIILLFIHGLVHLKGFEHGPKMDKIEKKFRKKFGV